MAEEQIEKKVLALKYRPKRFEDLVGQSTISQTLSLALDSNRLSHAYLFSGLRGSGKTSTARIMAKALLCSNGPTSKPCEVCENCKSANANRHLDIIEMDAASNRGIDDIKDLIEHTKYKPSSARFKVFIIDEVHMLTPQAFNALLKTLEEPPGFVKFILATTDPLKLPATILSRTQHFRFNKIAPSDVLHHLTYILNKENIDFETPALEILTRSGQGSLRDTLTLLDQAIIFSKGKITTRAVVDMLGLIEPELMDKLFDIILKKGDILEIVKELENYEISQVCDEMTIYLKHKMLEKDARFDLLIFDRFFRILSDAKHLLSMNSDGGFVLILTLSKMVEATNLKTIDDIINQVEQIEVEPETKKVENIKQEIVNVADKNTIEINSIDAVQTVSPVEVIEEPVKIEEDKIVEKNKGLKKSPYAFPTPFDEFEDDEDEPLEIKEVEEVTQIEETADNQQSVQQDDIQEVVYEPIVEPQIEDEPKLSENELLYKKLIEKVYERDYDLGEIFERNFIYKSFEDKKLQITTYAVGDERKILLKHYGVLKLFIYDIFGNDIEIKFIKSEEVQKGVEKKSNFQSEVKKQEEPALESDKNDTGSMVEDIEVGSGCVADMNKVINPAPSQKELQLNDILNSPQLNAAKELLRVKKITVKTKT